MIVRAVERSWLPSWTTPILNLKKPRHRWVKILAQDHIISWRRNKIFWCPDPTLLSLITGNMRNVVWSKNSWLHLWDIYSGALYIQGTHTYKTYIQNTPKLSNVWCSQDTHTHTYIYLISVWYLVIWQSTRYFKFNTSQNELLMSPPQSCFILSLSPLLTRILPSF